jgi:hypothetical protein
MINIKNNNNNNIQIPKKKQPKTMGGQTPKKIE